MTKNFFFAWFISSLIIFIFIKVFFWWGIVVGYKNCAKDFYKGKMKVELVENEDGTKDWVVDAKSILFGE